METTQISLSKGVYGLLKDHIRSNNKLLPRNKTQLEQELKHAKILPAKTIPEQVVGINTNVQIRDVETAEELNFELVAPAEAKIKNNKISILSAIGLALVGYETGDEVTWEFPEGLKTYKIEKVMAV